MLDIEFKYFETFLYPLLKTLSSYEIGNTQGSKVITLLYQKYSALEDFIQSHDASEVQRTKH